MSDAPEVIYHQEILSAEDLDSYKENVRGYCHSGPEIVPGQVFRNEAPEEHKATLPPPIPLEQMLWGLKRSRFFISLVLIIVVIVTSVGVSVAVALQSAE